jgi:hypothetical protein
MPEPGHQWSRNGGAESARPGAAAPPRSPLELGRGMVGVGKGLALGVGRPGAGGHARGGPPDVPAPHHDRNRLARANRHRSPSGSASWPACGPGPAVPPGSAPLPLGRGLVARLGVAGPGRVILDAAPAGRHRPAAAPVLARLHHRDQPRRAATRHRYPAVGGRRARQGRRGSLRSHRAGQADRRVGTHGHDRPQLTAAGNPGGSVPASLAWLHQGPGAPRGVRYDAMGRHEGTPDQAREAVRTVAAAGFDERLRCGSR